MPVYATQAELILLYGLDEATVSSDHDATGSSDDDAITAALRGASHEIEGYAGPYGVVPTDVGANVAATEGSFPLWWSVACLEMAIYRMSLNVGPATKEKSERYKHWIMRLESVYPSKLEDGDVPAASPLKPVIVGAGREFSSTKVVGL